MVQNYFSVQSATVNKNEVGVQFPKKFTILDVYYSTFDFRFLLT